MDRTLNIGISPPAYVPTQREVERILSSSQRCPRGGREGNAINQQLYFYFTVLVNLWTTLIASYRRQCRTKPSLVQSASTDPAELTMLTSRSKNLSDERVPTAGMRYQSSEEYSSDLVEDAGASLDVEQTYTQKLLIRLVL